MSVNETIEIRSLVSRGPKKILSKLAMESRRAVLSGSYFSVVTLNYTNCFENVHTVVARIWCEAAQTVT